MKKLIPLLVVAAGAVAYNVYKNRKETMKDQQKTFVVIDDSNNEPNHDQSAVESVNHEAFEDTVITEEQPASVPDKNVSEISEAVPQVDEVVEAMQEVQEELGIFETLNDMDEPYSRPSFFHLTDDSFIESEEEPVIEIISTIVVEDEEDVVKSDDSPEMKEDPQVEEVTEENEPEAVLEEVQEEILSTIVVEDTDEELEVEIELILEEQLDINEVVEFAEQVEEHILSTILVDDESDEGVPETIETDVILEVEDPVTEDESDEIVESDEEIVEPVEEPQIEFNEETVIEDEPIEIESLIEEIAEQIEEKSDGQNKEVLDESDKEYEVELEPLKSYNTPEVDELMKTIAGQVKAADQYEPEAVEEVLEEIIEEVPQFEDGDYLQDIKKITELYSEKVAQYNIRFPYLSSRFIDDTLKFSGQFNAEYPIGTRVAIEHHMHFNAVEDLFVFAQIIRQSGYHVKEGTEDKTLIVIREMFVDNNTILHDVFKVTNQVYCLSGEYQKFRITKR